MKTTFVGFVTKYALTVGIFQTNLEHDSYYPDMVIAPALGSGATFHGKGLDWHRERESAVARGETMRVQRLASLRKSIKALENKTITVVSK